MNIKKVLYVHTSVNVMNSFLPEISNLSYGTSKERQKKIENVMKEMIDFLEREDEIVLQEVEGVNQLEMPFSLEVNDLYISKARKRLQKQKIMRELRVVEQCVDILHTPFASGNFKFKELN